MVLIFINSSVIDNGFPFSTSCKSSAVTKVYHLIGVRLVLGTFHALSHQILITTYELKYFFFPSEKKRLVRDHLTRSHCRWQV